MAALEHDATGADAQASHSETAPARALLEVIDRDGQVRQSLIVQHWPLRVGRALDNDLVLSDPHLAAHHAELFSGSGGIELKVDASTRNGVQVGSRSLRGGERSALALHGDAVDMTLGRTHLRLRLDGPALAPELPLAAVATATQRFTTTAVVALVLLAAVLFNTYLQNDPDTLGRAIGGTLMMAIVVTAGWCTVWALLSKTFTRQAHFGWHLRVFLFAAIGLMLVDAVPALLAFSLSWPAATNFAFIGTYAVGAAALYFHLLAVEPARHRLLKWVATTGAVVGVVLSLWFNFQRSDRFGDELYMAHLFPPALRLARPVPADRFVDGLAAIKPALDRAAKEPARGDDANARSDDED
jgi:hypothetical protein